MTYTTVQTEHRGPALIVTIDRPGVLNALNVTVLTELADVLTEVARTPRSQIAGVVIIGAGHTAFAAGADISQMHNMTPEQGREFAAIGQRVPDLCEGLDRPVIACVNGYALGGGCEIALGCDFIYATENAQFGQPEVKLGLIPCFGGCARLQGRIGPARARELSYTGRLIDAAQAQQWGLVNRVLPDREALLEAAVQTVREMSGQGPEAIACVKATIAASTDQALMAGLAAERNGFAAMLSSGDASEGMGAFLEKRAPHFMDS